MRGHWSDCAVHNEPAMKAGSCDCDGLELAEDAAHSAVVTRISLPGRLGDFLRQVHREGLIEGHHLPPDGLSADAAAANLVDPHARVPRR